MKKEDAQMKTLGFRKYCVQVEWKDELVEMVVPARDENEAKLYVEDMGKIVAVQDITDTTPISVDKVKAALCRYGFDEKEIDIIAKTLLVTNIAD